MLGHVQIRVTSEQRDIHKQLVEKVRKHGWVFQAYFTQMELRELDRIKQMEEREAAQKERVRSYNRNE